MEVVEEIEVRGEVEDRRGVGGVVNDEERRNGWGRG